MKGYHLTINRKRSLTASTPDTYRDENFLLRNTPYGSMELGYLG